MLSFGEIVWDIYEKEECLGGAPLNLAAYAALLGEEAYLLSAVGNDELGRRAIERIRGLGVRTEYVSQSEEKATGRVLVELDENAVPRYRILEDVAFDAIPMPVLTEKPDVLAFGTLALRGEHNKRVLEGLINTGAFSEIFVDLNIRAPFYTKESILFCLERATIVKISEEELPVVREAISGEGETAEAFAAFLCERFGQIKLVIVTRGADGAFCYSSRERRTDVCAAQRARVVSTVGAGDSFSAAFLVRYWKTADVPSALNTAAKVSAFVVSHRAAIPAEAAAFLRTGLDR